MAVTSSKQALEEAALWLARLDAGTANRDEFEVWRAADPAHAAAFARIAGTWSLLDQAKVASHGCVSAEPEPPSGPARTLAELGWPPAPARTATQPGSLPVPARTAAQSESPPLSRRGFLRAAGVSGVALFVGGLYAHRAFAREQAETGVGERRLVRLPDGCQIELNTDTKVSWRFSPDARTFWLERGEATLLIAADAQRPCQLNAGSVVARLEAGEFNARLREQSLELLVVRGEGSIAGSVVPPAPPERVEAAVAWRRGEILFNGETLASAVDDYNRYLTRKLVIADASIANVRLGGRFTTSDPAPFLASLQAGFGVIAEPRADGTVALVAKSQDTRK